MKTTLIFVRHGKSTAPDNGVVQGQGISVPLSEEGRAQAEKLGEALSSLRFDRLFTSTSVRAIDTAAEIKGRHVGVSYEEIAALNERSKGEAEGMTHEVFSQTYPDIEEAWEREEDPRVPGGENFADVEKRAMPVIEGHLEHYPGQTLLYIVHGNLIRVLLGVMLGTPPEKRNRILQSYRGVSVIDYDHTKKRFLVRSINQSPQAFAEDNCR